MRAHATTCMAVAMLALVAVLSGCSDDDDDAGDKPAAESDASTSTMDASRAPSDAGQVGGDSGTAPTRDAAPAKPAMTCEPTGACDPFEDAGSCGDDACQLGGSGLSCGRVGANAGVEGERCDVASDCGRGLACMALAGGTQCVRLCPLGSVGNCGDDAACSGTTPAACVGFCRALAEPCDIFAQDCKNDGQSCTLAINEETDERYTGCMPAGSGGEGDSCANVAACGKGLICVGGSCVRVCQSGDAGSLGCTGGRRCAGRSQAWDIPYCR